jgi:hypothetical protein
MSSDNKPCFDSTIDKYEFDLTDPLKTRKTTQPFSVPDNGLITGNPDEDSSSSSDEDYKEPRARK